MGIRDELESRAIDCCPAILHYDLVDSIEEITDMELTILILQYEEVKAG